MGNACPKAVVFDFDGTLSKSRQPIEASVSELFIALAGKTTAAIMSGSAFPILHKNFLSRLPKTDTASFYVFPNAAAECHLWNGGADETLYNHAFTRGECTHITSVLQKIIEDLKIVEGLPSWGPRIDDRGAAIAFAGLGIDAPIVEKEAWDPDQKKRIPLHKKLQVALPDCEVHIGGTTTVEMTRKGIDKAYGIRYLANRLGVETKDMLFIGDALYEGGNDAAVIPTGIQTRQVSGPEETIIVLKKLNTRCSQ
ncbi:MAG TPA: HAD hydrolase family protein [Candidatus Paceibacterota bacterium]